MLDPFAGSAAFSELKNLCVWARTNGGMGSLYRSQHELVFVFKAGTGPHINNVELGRHGRYRTNVWSYPGINSFGRTRDADLASHPTVKPIALVKDAIFDCSIRGGLVLDAFAGSGTTLVAAAKAGRRGYGIELDLRYCDLIVRRVAVATGAPAIHVATGKPFAEVEQQRRGLCHINRGGGNVRPIFGWPDALALLQVLSVQCEPVPKAPEVASPRPLPGAALICANLC